MAGSSLPSGLSISSPWEKLIALSTFEYHVSVPKRACFA